MQKQAKKQIKEGNKYKQGTNDEHKDKKINIKKANETKNEQRGKEIGVKDANKSDRYNMFSNKLDKLSESNRLDCLYVPTV